MKQNKNGGPKVLNLSGKPGAGPGLTFAQFNAKAEAFLAGEFEAGALADLCAQALENNAREAEQTQAGQARPENLPDFFLRAKIIREYRYLACMVLGRHYEALADAYAMLGDFGEDLLHYQMLCSLSMRRNNHAAALFFIDRILDYGRLHEQPMDEYVRDRKRLLTFMDKIRTFTDADLHREVLALGGQAASGFAGIPLILSGYADFLVHKDTETPYLVFNPRPESGVKIFCQAAPSEVPFIHSLNFERPISVFGYLLSGGPGNILLQPANVLDFTPPG